MSDVVTLTFELDDAQAWALAQFVKRVDWRSIRESAVSDEEAYLVRDSLGSLAKALRDTGHAPR